MPTATRPREYTVRLRRPHPHQAAFIESPAKRKVLRAGRRGGKTVGSATLAVQTFLQGRRVLYAAPTQDQVETFWREVKRALQEPIDADVFKKNETLHVIERPGTENRIRAKTAWNADTLRGDYADLLILDEWQLMDEDAWEIVGAPMLLDNDGDAAFIYTPPSLRSRSVSKARDPRHAAKMFAAARSDTSGRWQTFHFRSHENPYISATALSEIVQDMTALAVRQEIEAEDVDEAPDALWTWQTIEAGRVREAPPSLARVVVAIDPAVTHTEASDETGLIVAGRAHNGHIYVLADGSGRYSPDGWARRAVDLFDLHQADRIIGEVNNGGEMVGTTLRTVRRTIPYTAVHASRGKAVRAEPVAALYEQGMAHHVGTFPELEAQLTMWTPGDVRSPDRLDSLVWAISAIMLPGMGRSAMVVANAAGMRPGDNPLNFPADNPKYWDTDRRR